jgi:hypothetical protein
MDAAVLEELMAADDPRHWYGPPDFDYDAELAAVAALRPTLESIVGQPLIIDRSVQDAAFFTELSYRTKPRSSAIGRVVLTYVAIRFSCFGRLVTVWGNVEEAPVTGALAGELASALRRNGYRYVPAADLEEPYSGSHVHAAGIHTWWLRFFDYC